MRHLSLCSSVVRQAIGKDPEQPGIRCCKIPELPLIIEGFAERLLRQVIREIWVMRPCIGHSVQTLPAVAHQLFELAALAKSENRITCHERCLCLSALIMKDVVMPPFIPSIVPEYRNSGIIS